MPAAGRTKRVIATAIDGMHAVEASRPDAGIVSANGIPCLEWERQPGGSLSEAERYRLEMLCQSNHFGLLAVRRAEKPPNPCEFFRVVFQGPQTPSPPLATSR